MKNADDNRKARHKRLKPKPRCEVCNGRFGLIRRRLAFKQFCSKRCLDQYRASRKHQPFSLKHWMEFSRG